MVMPFPAWRPGMVITAEALNARHDRIVLVDADQVLTSQTTGTASEIELDLEANAVYVYTLLVALSAVAGANSALAFYWDVPSGTLFGRFTQSLAASSATSLNSGGAIIMRRPANTTLAIAGGSDSTSPPSNFHSATEQGTITTGEVAGTATLMIQQSGSGSTSQTILRGGNQTRCVYRRIA